MEGNTAWAAKASADQRDPDRGGESLGIEHIEMADRCHHPGIVDEDRRRAERLRGLFNEPGYSHRIGDIAAHGKGVIGPDGLRHCLRVGQLAARKPPRGAGGGRALVPWRRRCRGRPR